MQVEDVQGENLGDLSATRDGVVRHIEGRGPRLAIVQPTVAEHAVAEPAPIPARRTNVNAVVSLNFGILWLFWLGSVIAVVCGHAAISAGLPHPLAAHADLISRDDTICVPRSKQHAFRCEV